MRGSPSAYAYDAGRAHADAAALIACLDVALGKASGGIGD